MKRLVLALGLAAMALAGCEEPQSTDVEVAPPPMDDTVVAPAAEDQAANAAATAENPPPVDSSTLPPDERASEATVQPESETLFY